MRTYAVERSREERADEYRTALEWVRLGVSASLNQLLEGISEPSGLPIPVQTALRQALETEERAFVAQVNAIGQETRASIDAAEQSAGRDKLVEMFDRARLEAALRA